MREEHRSSRRAALKTVGAVGAAAFWGAHACGAADRSATEPPPQTTDLRKQIFAKVWNTPLIDTHEHCATNRIVFPPAARHEAGRLDAWFCRATSARTC